MIHYIDSFPGREILLNGTPHLYFGGTSYLGLQDDLEFQQLFIENIKKYGTNYGASRKANIRFKVYEKGEETLAKLTGSESCITLSSGYLAGQLLASSFQKGYELFYAPNAHTALSVTHREKRFDTFKDLNIALHNHLNSKSSDIPVVFLDSIDFSGSNYPNFRNLKKLPLSKMILVVDDSHGIGVVGKNGCGVYRAIQELQPKKAFVCCSLGKGFGIQAGAIFGDSKSLETLKNTPFYGGSSPAIPAAIATYIQATHIYTNRRSILRKNIRSFLDKIHCINEFEHMQDYPTFSFQNPELVSYLVKRHIIVTDFKYPDEDAKTMSRIVISSNHTANDIKNITSAVNAFFKNF